MGAPHTASRRFGLFGGTFDPVHYGHLRAAEEIREAWSLDWVEFLPARTPPHKTHTFTTAISDRLAMLRLAMRGHGGFRVSEVEARRSGASYLADTLEQYRDLHPPSDTRMFFIMGMDSFTEIATWHRFSDLFGLSDFLVLSRPGYPRPNLDTVLPPAVSDRLVQSAADPDRMEHSSGHATHFVDITPLDISASRIREHVRQGRSVRFLLPDEVVTYIGNQGLYRDGPR